MNPIQITDRPVAERLLRDLRSGDDALRRAAARRLESDPTLRQDVERLLAATVDSGVSAVDHSAFVPQWIGAYQLLAELGSGGMGAVFLAERDIDGTPQRVALKLLHGMPTSEGRRRFARERALLAGLNHPNIAALLDGGQTEAGQPYLVMEYVDGQPISDWARSTRPSLAERLRVMLRVCAAVEHAHQRLVLHRDIKPGNILVRADAEPVLLDFGIGKVIDESSGRGETATLAFTPAYAAPEQQAGRGLTTATDVYGLGAVLFEVLSECSLTEIRTDLGPLPLLSAICRDPQLARALRGDLDRMVAKAMHADPDRRYASAADLAEDVERFLSGRPILATPDSLGYRLRKLISRHRAASALAVLAVLLSLSFVWRLNVERVRAQAAEHRAQAEAQGAKRARDFLVSVFDSAAPGKTLGAPVSPRSLLDKARERVEKDLGSDADAAVATWLALADTYSALGAPDEAAKAAEQALRYTQSQTDEQRALRAQVQETLATAYDNLGRHEDALPLQQEALHWREAEAEKNPGALTKAYGELGYAAQQRGDYAQSERLLKLALDRLGPLQVQNADDYTYLRAGLAISVGAQGRVEEAERLQQQTEDAAVLLNLNSPTRVYALRARSRVDELAGRFPQSLAALEQATELATRVVGVDASVVTSLENDLGVALNGVGRYREALTHLQNSRAGLERLNDASDSEFAFIDANLSALYESLGDYAQAIAYARRALAVYVALPSVHAPMRRQARVNLARALSFAGVHDEALAQMQIALDEGVASEGAQSLSHQLDRFRYAGILRRAGRLDPAEQELADSGKHLLAELGAEHPLKLHLMRLEALIARDRGQLQPAIAGLRAALRFAEGREDMDAIAVAEAQLDLADLLRASAPAEARTLVAQALPVLQQALLPIAPILQRAQTLHAQLNPAPAGSASAPTKSG